MIAKRGQEGGVSLPTVPDSGRTSCEIDVFDPASWVCRRPSTRIQNLLFAEKMRLLLRLDSIVFRLRSKSARSDLRLESGLPLAKHAKSAKKEGE